VKLEDNLRQIKKRIAELQRKAEWIELQLPSVNTNMQKLEFYKEAQNIVNQVNESVVIDDYEEAEVLVEQPRRRGRRKLNETK
jgi:hypothetical protein